ncbi:sensor domain-containing protein [Haloplasma contractile]|uniref:Two-component system chemotaxis family CheB-CheR fusion protein n=1 Tax=Haloplasma contractile SSD-17B TaxID=1033810 RepID=F7PRI6_9MOLU|nr:bifunctional diguanylate cyclase/phosphodiesterase [Haloplasma contractile]ERJ11687.1 two-component system chemotaxis family CheB-CheR fusion protein [Haloplasma contractile SSD-17B]
MKRKLCLGKRFGLYILLLFLFYIITVILFEYHRELHDVKDLLLINGYEVAKIKRLENQIHIVDKIIEFMIMVTTLATAYFVYRLYKTLIIPLNKGINLVNNLDTTNKKWEYDYNNELKFLVNSVNNFIDVSNNSFKLLEVQNKKLKLFTEIQDINYYTVDTHKMKIKLILNQKSREQYQVKQTTVEYNLDEYAECIHPDDQEQFKGLVESVLENNLEEYRAEYRVRLFDKHTYYWITTFGRKINDYTYNGVQVDITDLKRTERKLYESREEYKIIVENTSDLISKTSPDGLILYASESYMNLFSKGGNCILGKSIYEIDQTLHNSNADWLTEMLQKKVSTTNEISINTNIGARWFLWNNDVVLNDHGQVLYIISVGRDITDIKHANKQLKYESEHDLLTNLYNRRGLMNQLDSLETSNLAVFFIDIDNFKDINDFYGHEVGDQVIKEVAKKLLVLKKYNCILGRLSGDEFLLIYKNYPDGTSIKMLSLELEYLLRTKINVNHFNIHLSASIGYAVSPLHTKNISKLIAYSDIAMYQSKLHNKGRTVKFNHDMYKAVEKKVRLANDLKEAILHDQFKLVYQSVIDHNSGEIKYVETLVRWIHGTKGPISPGEFLHVAEEIGLMQDLDELIINKAIKQYSQFSKQAAYKESKLTINVSRSTLLTTNLADTLTQIVNRYQVKPSHVCIEISESTFVNKVEESREKILRLREKRFIIALDDFGRDYSSLSILDRLDYDLIKTDRHFVKNLNRETNVEILKMIHRIAMLQNKEVIIEGVEEEKQLTLIQELGFSLIQGFYYSIPNHIGL